MADSAFIKYNTIHSYFTIIKWACLTGKPKQTDFSWEFILDFSKILSNYKAKNF